MKRTLLLLQVALIADPAWAQQAWTATHPDIRSLILNLAPHITEELDALADTLRIETVRCLIGVVRGQTADVDLAWEPPIELSTASQVQYQSCPSATLALWHNHPPIPGEAPEYGCYLSATDIREALDPRSPPIQIVQVTANVACWWSQWQILRTGQVPVLLPQGKQRWGRSLQLDEAACRGELRHLVACTLLLGCERGGGVQCRPREVGPAVARLAREEAPAGSRGSCAGTPASRPGCSSQKP